ncbi:MAG: hypothetical protein ACTSRL_03865 [Candidatus Helarchaeota archaeon]
MYDISHFLNEKYDLLPSEIISSSIITFLLGFVFIGIILFPINLVFGLFIAFIISYAISYKIFQYPLAIFTQERLILLKYSDLAFQNFLLILNTTGSIFDAIQFIYEANYPLLSKMFNEMLFQINFNGKSPESLLQNFIDQLPNSNLKERLINLLATKFRPGKLLKQLEDLVGDKKMEYEVFTRQLESKLIILVGICLFFPIMFSLFISFFGNLANYSSFLFIIAFFISTSKFKSNFLKTNFELIGEMIFSKKNKQVNKEANFEEFINFLSYFGNELKLGVSQETALWKAYNSYHGKLKPVLRNCINDLIQENKSFKVSWNGLKNSISHPQIKFIIDIIERMLTKSSEETGIRIISIVQQLKINQELIKERQSLIRAQQFKIKFLTFIMSAILGVIGGLSPLLFQISQIFNNPATTFIPDFWITFPLIFSLFLISIYSSYFLNDLVKSNNIKVFSLWAGMTYVFTCYVTYMFLI